MNKHESDNFLRLAPLISAWGTAVEEGQDSVTELANLKWMQKYDPEALLKVITLAEIIQTSFASRNYNPNNVAINAPSHPRQRLARISRLKELLNITPPK